MLKRSLLSFKFSKTDENWLCCLFWTSKIYTNNACNTIWSKITTCFIFGIKCTSICRNIQLTHKWSKASLKCNRGCDRWSLHMCIICFFCVKKNQIEFYNFKQNLTCKCLYIWDVCNTDHRWNRNKIIITIVNNNLDTSVTTLCHRILS